MRQRSRKILLLTAAFALLVAPNAFGSVLIASGAKNVNLKITPSGQGLVEYTKAGSRQFVLLWGALNAQAHPTCGEIHGASCGPAQVVMKHRRLFLGGAAGRRIIRGPDRCLPYDGPELARLVAACKAPDGTYWAAQNSVPIAPHHGVIGGAVKELRLSHWHGPLEHVLVRQTWQKAHGHYLQRLYGQVTYRGQPVYGLRWNRSGLPLDGYGRFVYLDTFNSGYGTGWRRVSDFLSKPAHGEWCYNLGGPHVNGAGDAYRVTAIGTGVTPDILVGPFSAMPASVFEWNWYVQSYKEQLALSQGSSFCHPQRPR